MNLQEQIERAFEAGAEFVIDNVEGDEVEYPSGAEIEIATNEYINEKALAETENDGAQ